MLQMLIIIGSIFGAIITSVITTKILASHYFKIVDGYVEDVCNRTKNFVESIEYFLEE